MKKRSYGRNKKASSMNPELSFQEVETAKYIEDFYKGKIVK